MRRLTRMTVALVIVSSMCAHVLAQVTPGDLLPGLAPVRDGACGCSCSTLCDGRGGWSRTRSLLNCCLNDIVESGTGESNSCNSDSYKCDCKDPGQSGQGCVDGSPIVPSPESSPSPEPSPFFDDSPTPDSSPLFDDSPSPDPSLQYNDSPSPETSPPFDDSPSPEFSLLFDDSSSAESSLLFDDSSSAESSALLDDSPSPESSLLFSDSPSHDNNPPVDSSPVVPSSPRRGNSPAAGGNGSGTPPPMNRSGALNGTLNDTARNSGARSEPASLLTLCIVLVLAVAAVVMPAQGM